MDIKTKHELIVDEKKKENPKNGKIKYYQEAAKHYAI